MEGPLVQDENLPFSLNPGSAINSENSKRGFRHKWTPTEQLSLLEKCVFRTIPLQKHGTIGKMWDAIAAELNVIINVPGKHIKPASCKKQYDFLLKSFREMNTSYRSGGGVRLYCDGSGS